MNFREQNINEKKGKNFQEFEEKFESDNSSERETKENKMEDIDKDELTILNSITDNNLRILLPKILSSNKALKNEVKILKDKNSELEKKFNDLKEDIFKLKNFFKFNKYYKNNINIFI